MKKQSFGKPKWNLDSWTKEWKPQIKNFPLHQNSLDSGVWLENCVKNVGIAIWNSKQSPLKILNNLFINLVHSNPHQKLKSMIWIIIFLVFDIICDKNKRLCVLFMIIQVSLNKHISSNMFSHFWANKCERKKKIKKKFRVCFSVFLKLKWQCKVIRWKFQMEEHRWANFRLV